MDRDTHPRILLLEDSDIDAELAVTYLRRAGADYRIERCVRRAEFEAAVARDGFDLVLADYSLPDFDGMAALDLVRRRWPHLPFIFVSGVVGEDIATEAVRQGATDYVLKRQLTRLPRVVARALAEARERSQRERAEMLFRLAVEAADIGVWEYASADGSVRLDDGMRKLLGVSATAVPLAAFISNMVHAEDRAAVARALSAAARDDAPPAFEFEHRVLHEGHRLAWLAVTGRRIVNAEGHVMLVGTARDVTEQRRRDAALRDTNEALEQRVARRTEALAASNRELKAQIAERSRVEATLQQMQRLEAVGQLTSGVAHDFNNLLTVVLSNLSLIRLLLNQQGQPVDPRVLQRLDSMRNAAERGGKLTSQLLAFSRRQRLEPTAVDLNDIVLGMRDLLQTTMGGSVQIDTALSDALWPALADPTQLELIILNLAINARDAMEVGGKLTVRTRNVTLAAAPVRVEEPEPGDYVALTVSDSGSGIPPQVLAKVFEPFFTTKQVGKGSGLGLAQVYGFAKQSGGGVRIDTEVGAGTSVHVFMPRTAQPAATPAVAPDIDAVPDGAAQAHTLMLVDDDDDVREVTAATLGSQGYRVIQAAGGEEAIALLDRHHEVEVVLADFAMPGMNGAELRRVLRARHPHLRVVFLTGFADLTALQDVQEDLVLQKPLYGNELGERLQRLLRPAAAVPAPAAAGLADLR